MTTRELLRSDLAEMHRYQRTWRWIAHPGMVAVILYRLGHAAVQRGPLGRLVSQVLSLLSLYLTGAEIHAEAQIGPRLRIPHAQGIGVGSGVVAGAGLTLYAHTNLGASVDGGPFPRVGDDVMLGLKSSVLGGVTIGDRVQVAAHALVISDIPSDRTALGVPAKAARTIRA